MKDIELQNQIFPDGTPLNTEEMLEGVGNKITEASSLMANRFKRAEIYLTHSNKNLGVSEEQTETYEESGKNMDHVFNTLEATGQIETKMLEHISRLCKKNLNRSNAIVGCVNCFQDLDDNTSVHSLNVALLSSMIGGWLGMSEEDKDRLFLAGLLHDMGKAKLDPKIVNKKRRFLTPEEAEEKKKHVLYGKQILEKIGDIPEIVRQGIYAHHERMDGSGYPDKLTGNNIPLFARIVAVADVYDTMLSEGVDMPGQTPFFIMETLLIYEIDKLDPKVVLTLLKNVANYYLGLEIVLSDGEVGEVVFVHPHCIYRPIVRVQGEYIDLYERRDLKIMGVHKTA
jgi:putative nucleotidyltransferase with HDIG domain